ncbi:hypothetical protein EG68_11274 [Paragonimus skrjabini miyazakii]|uniref:DUF5731 domain-containing protein n=1 Tax=Paragonimus skrjabini miyazakii TaxID=59628 RepID=A0A8S9YHR3_9TREM|nr:hypothetical protein EG68_11274 [Paragonimus skrjabini miyazakii]
MPKYYSGRGPFVQLRQSCFGRNKCPLSWLPPQDTQALTFKLIGSDDMRDYEFQAHFCAPIYAFHHRYCTGEEGEIAFELRQTGTWLTLDRVNCRCLGVADVEHYGYSKGVLPKDKVFRGNYLQMTCAKRMTLLCNFHVLDCCFSNSPFVLIRICDVDMGLMLGKELYSPHSLHLDVFPME